jgi:molybdopterin/thiamine biosynthesis adenylyltransferase/rhodanese-related sulfurtransferase
MSLSEADLVRYSRHLALREIGVAGQERLKAARVLVIGAGGLGSPSLLYLAASGVGTLGIVDHDRVDASNLQRQVLYANDVVGESKVRAAERRLAALNPELRIERHEIELRADNVLSIFANYDVVLDGTDRFATRYLSNDACVILRKPLVSAAIHRFEGQALTYVPDRGPCYRCLFPEPPAAGLVPNCAEAGVLGVLPGVMGAIQATEAIKLIVGAGEVLLGRLLTYDALGMRFSEFKFARRADCAVCGDHPSITVPRDMGQVCSVEELAAVVRLTPQQVKERLERAPRAFRIVDVREPAEFAVGHLPGAVNIPIGELERRFDEVRGDGTLLFVCRSGARSLTASGLARRLGVNSPVHLEGGLLAWARDVDPSFAVAPVGQ